MSTNMIRRSPAPSDRAASTYSRSLIDSVCPRTMRPTAAQLKNTMIPIATARLGPTIEISAIAKSRNGNERITSIMRARKRVDRTAEVARRHADEHADRARRASWRRRPASSEIRAP